MPILAAQHGKDRTILAAADRIDAIAPAAAPHTAAQRHAVAAAPASDVAHLTAQYDRTINALTAQVTSLAKQLRAAQSATHRVIRISGYSAAALLVAAGVATFFLLGRLSFLGPRVGFALIAAGTSIFGMMQAYDFTQAHPWIIGIALGLLLIAGALAFANHWHTRAAASPAPAPIDTLQASPI